VYESFYGFREKPFNLTPDPRFLYLSARHAEALAHLEFGQRERGGFVVITGEVGTGKTTLARHFLARRGEAAATAFVMYPAVTAVELLQTVLEELHLPDPGPSLKARVDALHAFLLEARRAGRDVLVLVDEAQDLAPEVLEQLRLVSNLETETEKLLTIVLVGQTELREMLERRELRQLAQRVTARYHLGPLAPAETEAYVRHRIAVADGLGKVTFTPGALRMLARRSRGVPRLINALCDRTLVGGYARGQRTIDAALVQQAAREVEGERAGRQALRTASVGALGAAAGLLAFALIAWLRGEAARPSPPTSPTAAESVLAAPPSGRAALDAVPPASASEAGLEPLLLAPPGPTDRATALAAVAARWGEGPLRQATLVTHLAHLRQLDLPAALALAHPTRRAPLWLALVGLDGERARVVLGGAELTLSLREIDRFWTREAVIAFRDEDDVVADPERREVWTRARLQRLGMLAADGALDDGVRRFQRSMNLEADGVAGPRTLLALYALGDGQRPHLVEQAGGRTTP